jgi:hypothetical protein
MLRIAWAHYSNDELAREFRKWAEKNRPKSYRNIPACKKLHRGQQLRHFRVALRRLGIMRLNYHYTRHRLQVANPEAWQRLRDCYKEWYEAPAWTRGFFLKLFPFLKHVPQPMHEDPIHFLPKRKGKRIPAAVLTVFRNITP